MPDEETRQSMLKRTGALIGGGAAGVAGMTGRSSAYLFISGDTIYNESVETLCDIGPPGLGVWAAGEWSLGSAAVSFLGTTVAGATAGCALRDEFVEHFPDADRIEIKRPSADPDGQYNDIDEGDIVVVPADSRPDVPWWFFPA